MSSRRWGLSALLILAGPLACGTSDLRVFDVKVRTVRNCHPAGLLAELCDDSTSFAGQFRTTRITLEMLGADTFVLYDDEGRSLPGRWERDGYLERDVVQDRRPPVRRQYYFARQADGTRDASGCHKEAERNAKFRLERDLVVKPGDRAGPTRIVGTFQERATQTLECGQATVSRHEEAFEGEEVGADPGPSLPSLPGGPEP